MFDHSHPSETASLVRTLTPEEAKALELWAPASMPATAAVETVFLPQSIPHEPASAWDRSKALALRLTPFLAVWLVLAGGLVWKLQASMQAGFVVFAALTGATLFLLNWLDYQHSGGGVERRRIDQAAKLKTRELDQQHQLRRAALNYFTKARKH